MTPETARLEIRNLVRRFGSVKVVDDVSLHILPGQVTCLLGPSGCGKSTTLRMIAGIEAPDSGEIYVDGRLMWDTMSSVSPESRSIGLMFQDFALFPHLTVEQNVVFGLTGSLAAQRERAVDLLDRVGLRQHIKSYPHALSGGEQQRVALVRALAPQPRILLMDDPFSGLDNRLRDGIRDETLALLKEEDTAVLLVTHEPEEAMRMADEIALMRNGRIIQSGAPYNLFTAPFDKQAMSFFSDINVIQSTVHGALAKTPFGQFLSPGMADGTPVDIVVRPQHIKIDFDRNGKGPDPTAVDGVAACGIVERARFMGRESLVEFRLYDSAEVLRVTVPNVFLPNVGQRLWLTVPRKRCFIFPQKA